MAEAYLIRKSDGSFLPAYEADREALKRFKVGDPMKVTISKPRSIDNHRRFFAMLDCTIDNLPDTFHERYRNQEYLRYECLVAVGHCIMHETLGGKIIYQPKSMSFGSMDEDEFQKLYTLVANYLLKWFLKDMDIETFEKNLKLYM